MQNTSSNFSFIVQEPSPLSSEELHSRTLKAAKSEKEATLVLLEHLAMIEEQRVYAVMGYPSLWLYVHQALGFSEPQTSERINAMRLMRNISSVKRELESGNLTLTVTSKLASHVKRAGCTEEETQALLQAVTGKTTREAERVLAQNSTISSKPDQVRPLSQELTRITIEVDSEFLTLLKRAQELGGHPGSTPQELFKMGLAEFVKKREVKVQPANEEARKEKQTTTVKNIVKEDTAGSKNNAPLLFANEVSEEKPQSRYIPKAIRVAVRLRSQDQCEYVHAETGKRCESRMSLEFDHFPKAFSKGGGHGVDQIRHFCKSHNLLSAIQEFGAEKIAREMEKSK